MSTSSLYNSNPSSATTISTVPNDKLRDLANNEETQFMSLLLQSKDLIANAVKSGITVEHFQNEAQQRLYRLAMCHFTAYQGNVLSRPALESMLASDHTPEEAAKVQAQYDRTVATFGVAEENYGHLKDGILGRHKQRRAYEICRKYADELLTATRDQSKIVERMSSEVARIGEGEALSITPMSTSELLAKEIIQPAWVIEGVLCEGVTLLASKPKLGKSFLAMQCSDSVGNGTKFLGKFLTRKGRVLHLALEDNDVGHRNRLAGMQIGSKNVDVITGSTGFKRLDQGGLEFMLSYLKAHPDLKLIVIDTLQKVKPAVNGRGTAYDQDYQAMDGLAKFAVQNHIAVLCLHHLRKAVSEDGDPFDQVSGSLGLTGTADTTFLLKRSRGKNEAILTYQSRQMADSDGYQLTFDASSLQWSCVGEQTESTSYGEARTQIIDVLKDLGGTASESQIRGGLEAKGISRSRDSINHHLRKLETEFLVEHSARGAYSLTKNDWNSN